MNQGYSRYIPLLSLAGELAIVNSWFVGVFLDKSPNQAWHAESLLFYLYINFVWLILSQWTRAYELNRHTQKLKLILYSANQIVLFFFLFLLYFQFRSFNYLERNDIKNVFLFFSSSLILWKIALYYFFILYRKSGYNFRQVLVVGINATTTSLMQYFMADTWHGYRLIGYVGIQDESIPGHLGKVTEVSQVIKKYRPDEIYLSYQSLTDQEKECINEILSTVPVQIHLVPDLGNLRYHSMEWRNLGNVSVLAIHSGPLGYASNRIIKRLFDITFSVIIISFVVIWVGLLLFLYDKLSRGGGIWYKQKRTSINGKTFTIYKFRSMIHNEEADSQQAVQNDQRITRMGTFLRQTNIDELPQFFNVLLGQMSVVGPRPHMLAHTEEYSRRIPSYMLRHSIKPGMTGLAQVYGYRGEIRHIRDIQNRLEKDLEYIASWSLWLDIQIIIKTLWLVVKAIMPVYKNKKRNRSNKITSKHTANKFH